MHKLHIGSALALALTLVAGCDGGNVAGDASVADGQAPGDASSDGDVADATPVDAGVPDAGPPDLPSKGPWVLGVDTTSATVRWETRVTPESLSLEYRPEGAETYAAVEGTSRPVEVDTGYGVDSLLIDHPDVPGTYFMNDVELEGLEPATCYEYRIAAFAGHGGRFCTMHEPTDHETPIRFLTFGDTSPLLGHTQRILEHTLPADPEFVVHAGDLQYYSALLETWTLWFDEMVPLLEQGAMYPCIGNHEEELDGDELENYYARFWDAPGEDGDTFAYHYQSGGVHFFALNSEDQIGPEDQYERQFPWLEARLDEVADSEGYRFSIVYFHHPAYTLARHEPKLDLRERLEPIIDGHRVPLVLQGHNHVYERFEVGPVTYLVVGGGGSGRYDVDENVARFPDEVGLRVQSGSFHHGALITIENDTIEVDVIDADGMTRDRFEKTVDIAP